MTKKDILTYIEKRKTQKGIPAQPLVEKKERTAVPAPSFIPSEVKTVSSGSGIERIPMDNIRQRIMDHMVASRDTSVHVTSMIEIDMNRIHNFIQEKKLNFNKATELSLHIWLSLHKLVLKP